MTRSVLTEADKDRIHALAETRLGARRLSARAIGALIGRSENAVAWYMYRHGLQRRATAAVAPTYTRADGTVIWRYSGDEDAFILSQRKRNVPTKQIAAATTARFGRYRSTQSVKVRLIILAGFEAAAEDEGAVKQALAA